MVSCLSILGIVPLPRCAPLAGRYTDTIAKEINFHLIKLDYNAVFPQKPIIKAQLRSNKI